MPKWLKITVVVLVLTGLIALGFVAYNIMNSSNGVDTGESQQNTVRTEPVEIQEYAVIEEKDVSAKDCKEVVYKIKVSDDADDAEVERTELEVINTSKDDWDKITVLTYNDSDSDTFVRNNDFTVSKSEFGSCN